MDNGVPRNDKEFLWWQRENAIKSCYRDLIRKMPLTSMLWLTYDTLYFMTSGFNERLVRFVLDKAKTEKEWRELYEKLSFSYFTHLKFTGDIGDDYYDNPPIDKLPEWFRNLKNPFTSATPDMEEIIAALKARGVASQPSVQQQTSEEEAKKKELAHKLTPYFRTSKKEEDALLFVKKIWGMSPSIIVDEVVRHIGAQEIVEDFNRSGFCKALKEYGQYEPTETNFRDTLNRKL